MPATPAPTTLATRKDFELLFTHDRRFFQDRTIQYLEAGYKLVPTSLSITRTDHNELFVAIFER